MSHAKMNDTMRLKQLQKQYNLLRRDAGIVHLALMSLLCEKVNGDAGEIALPEGLSLHVGTAHVRTAHEMSKQNLDLSVTLDTAKHTLTITVVKAEK